MTQAEKFAKLFNDDGQCWETKEGIGFDEMMEKFKIREEWKHGHRAGMVVRHVFPDGSVITSSGGAWDFGYEKCFCWVGGGHTEECEALPRCDRCGELAPELKRDGYCDDCRNELTCEDCGDFATKDYYSKPDSLETGIGLVLCAKCAGY